MGKLIAVVDDEPDILELVSLNLKKEGYRVKTYAHANDFYKSLDQEYPDLLVLDLMLPDTDGLDVCKYLRNMKKVNFPIVMLTAKDDEFDKVLGLELGADDYVTKPFSIRELQARIKAVLRRSMENASIGLIIIENILKIDLQKYEVLVNDEPIVLTATEFKLLKILAEKRGFVYSRERLLTKLWGDDKLVVNRTIDVHVKNLREKMGEAGKFIINVRGVGYKMS
ncbi:MAG: response regulator transcription factor [Candidatus Marinimicrobia bacterium]|nr:response regulator transcription factor [Candidatus Neomarinimicrobiota bacterium]